MRRATTPVVVVAVVLLGLVLMGKSAVQGVVQESSPAASPPAGPVGVTSVLIGGGEPVAAPGHELTLRRVTIAPGGSIPAHTHPGALVIVGESGIWEYTPQGGTGRLSRGAVAGTPSPAEDLTVETELILHAGDVLYVEEPAADIRNAGDEPVVLLIAGLTRFGEPFTAVMEGTPMATLAP
jgi:quercetin dioxygenase-like cupin family protein